MNTKSFRGRSKIASTALPKGYLPLISLLVLTALAMASFALTTRSVKTKENEPMMPTLIGKAAEDYLKKADSYESLDEAVAAMQDDDPTLIPSAEMMLRAPDASTSDQFGWSVAITEDTAVVGSNLAAYVFIRASGTWNFQQKLIPVVVPPFGLQTGMTVGISGDTVIVGAPLGQGPAAYIYVRNAGTWSLQQTLNGADSTGFGSSVDVFGDTAVVGASVGQGSAYVWVRSGGVWAQQQQLSASDAAANDSFGARVAISEERIAVGAPGKATGAGAVYVFVRSGTTWTQEQKLISGDPGNYEYFGWSVDISGGDLIIGSRGGHDGINPPVWGAAYYFKKETGANWTQMQKLTSSDQQADDQFGFAVAISGNLAIISAAYHDISPSFNKGAAYAFVRCDGPWTQHQKIIASNGAQFDVFGWTAAVSGNSVFLGSPNNRLVTNGPRGTVYVTPTEDLNLPPCETEIEVNITADQADADVNDEVCDSDFGQTGNQCSLRAAIETANANDGPDTISFNIPGVGPHTITTLTQLPSLSETATIDATTQPGYSGTPLIELSGNSALGGVGFVAGSTNSILRGMAINRFAVGVGLQASGVKIERCYFNLSPDGSAAGTASDHVIAIDIRGAAATNNTIGGTGNLGNIISNSNVGVGISEGATGNKIFGNRIGTNVSGTSSIPNVVGAFISASSGNKIGDTVAGTGNLISGNSGSGVVVNLGSSNNIVTGNLIGTNATGIEAIANGNGVIVDASNNNRVGSDTGTNGNVISGSTFTAVTLKLGSANNVVVGNKIGTNLDGTAAIPNQFGIGIDAANDNTIGDLTTSTKGNLISGNSEEGVVVQANSANNRVSYNAIGTNGNGTEVLSNGEVGILVTGGAQGNFVEKNVVGGHNLTTESSGIGLAATAGPNNSITGNFIGVVRNGTAALPNTYGISCFADTQIIGVQNDGNIIGHNSKGGIRVVHIPGGPNPVVEDNIIQYNFVGTNGSADIGNAEIGIALVGEVEDTQVKNNVVSGNTFVGIALGLGPRMNLIKENFVGTNTNGTTAIANALGIGISGASDNTLESNLVSGNNVGILLGDGIGIDGISPPAFFAEQNVSPSGNTFTSGNKLFLNKVGVNADATAAIPNRVGIGVGENARDNLIGVDGPNLVSGNTHAPDLGWGIFVGTLRENPSTDVVPQGNIFQRNGVGLAGNSQLAIPNTKGLVLIQARGNTFGGATNELANIIIASTAEGIGLGLGVEDNIFLKNFLGVLPPTMRRGKTSTTESISGSTNFGNGGHGILVENGASGNTLGGTTSAEGLVISGNGGNGIRIDSTAGSGNRMGANSISGNTLPGIDLGGDGFTVNDPTDADVGPNNLQNYPTMTFIISSGNLIVNYQVDSALANSNYGTTGLTVQFFEADGSGAGVSSLGLDQYTASDYSNGTPGWKKKNLGNAAALGFAAGDMMTATATDTDGNSSEFSPAVSSAPSAISGTITYGNAIGAPNPRFVSNVLISGSGSTNVSTTTAAPGAIAGQYTLMGFGAGSYTVTPTKTGGVNNITSFDAARISQHVAGPPNPQLTGNQLLVADVSGNSVVSSFDAAMIAKFVAGPPFAAPGIGSTSTWRFTPTNKNYPSVASSIAGEDYSALLMGEVSGNWNNTGARPAGKVNNGQWTMDSKGMGPERGISVELPTLVSVDKEIVVPVNVQGIANKGVIAYEFDLRYDPTVIQPIVEPADLKDTASRGLLVVTNATEPGLLRVVVYGAYPIDGDGVLLNLRFTSVGAVGSMSPISFGRIMFNEGESRVLVTDGKVELF
ncbi:MAG: hypothetical protein IPL32_11760 [Chloracidobacterium sp.]|nr:hypothetical protein [Chloracidobacterium sp.]